MCEKKDFVCDQRSNNNKPSSWKKKNFDRISPPHYLGVGRADDVDPPAPDDHAARVAQALDRGFHFHSNRKRKRNRERVQRDEEARWEVKKEQQQQQQEQQQCEEKIHSSSSSSSSSGPLHRSAARIARTDASTEEGDACCPASSVTAAVAFAAAAGAFASVVLPPPLPPAPPLPPPNPLPCLAAHSIARPSPSPVWSFTAYGIPKSALAKEAEA